MKKNLIWDLSGTLLKPSIEGLTEQEIANYSLYFLMWSGKKTASDLDLVALKIMNKALPQSSEFQSIRTHTGDSVPEVICQFLAGHLSSHQAREIIDESFHQWNKTSSETEENKKQVKKMLHAFFTPETSERSMQPIEQTVKLLEKCHATKESSYILSNWDKESFSLIYTKFEDTIFSYFKREHIGISGNAGYLKPQDGIYTWFLETYSLDPSTCLFIDDQKENVAQAQKRGIESLQYTPSLFTLLQSTLKRTDFCD